MKSLSKYFVILSSFVFVGSGCKTGDGYFSPVIDSPQNGTHIAQNKVDVTGHLIISPTAKQIAAQNEAKKQGKVISAIPTGDVYVNGLKAQTNGFSWYIKDLPLIAGKNTIRAHHANSPTKYDTEITVYADIGNQPPVASFTTAPSSGYAPLTVQLDASGSSDSDGTITSYAWDFGDSKSGTGKKVTHVFEQVGSYTVKLTVTDNLGLTQSTTRLVSVNKPNNQIPTAIIEATPLSGLAPLTVTFSGQKSSDLDGQIVQYHWNFGDQQTATGTNVTHTYTQAGNYTATLTVADNDGGMGTATIAIQVTADTTPPSVTSDLSDGTILHTRTPLITFSYSDTQTGINAQSVAVFVDGTDVTSHAAIDETSALLQFTEDFPVGAGSHQISVRVADGVGNIAQVSRIFTVDLGEISSGFIVGKVLDLQGNPIPGVEVSSILSPVGENLIGTTDSNGVYKIPFLTGGSYRLKASKTGWTTGVQNVDPITGRDSSVETMHLMQADTKETLIPAASGGTATNSSGSISLSVPSGALAQDTKLSFTEATSGEGLQIALPNLSQFTYAMDNQPSGTVFSTPATMTIANILNFAPGTKIPYGIIDENIGVWTDSGHVGTVSSDGKTVQFPADHFSQYDINYPLFLTDGQANPNPRADGSNGQQGNGAEPCLTCGSSISNASGSLGLDYSLPPVLRNGKNYALNFSYQSLSAKPSVILGSVNGNANQSNAMPNQLKARFQFSNALIEENYPAEANVKPSLVRTLVDAKNGDGTYLPTGSYPYKVELGAVYSNINYATAEYFGGPATGDTGVKTRDPVALKDVITSRAVVQNETLSPFGAGWTLNGFEKLAIDPDGTVALTDGSGSIKVFSPIGKAGVSSEVKSIKTNKMIQDQSLSQTIYHQGYIYATSCEANQVYRIAQNGTVQVLAGTGKAGFSGDLKSAQNAELNCPSSIAPSRRGGFYIADRNNHRIRYIDRSGKIRTVAGGNNKDIPITPTFLKEDSVLALHFVSDQQIYTVSPHSGKILKLAGTGNASIRVPFQSPAAFDIDENGNFIVFDTGRNQVLKIYPINGEVRVILDQKSKLDHPVDFAYDPVLKRYFILEKSGQVQLWNGPGHDRLVPLALTPTGFQMTKFAEQSEKKLDLPTALTIAYSPETGLISSSSDGLRFKTLGLDRSQSKSEIDPPSETIYFASPEGEFSQLIQMTNGNYLRTLVTSDIIQYSPNGLILQRSFRNAETISYSYDNQNRLTRVTLPDGSFYTLSYDLRGYLSSVTDPANRTTQFAISTTGQLKQIVAPDQTARSYAYLPDNLLTAQKDENGNVTEYQYTNGRLTGEIYPGNRARGVSSAALNGLNAAIDPQTVASSFSSPEGRNHSIGLDRFGMEFSRSNGSGDMAYRLRNDEGQPTQQTSFAGRVSFATYNQYGSPTLTIDQKGQYRYDYLNSSVQKPTAIYDANNTLVLAITYSVKTQISSITDAHGRKTSFTYFPVGDQTKTQTDALGNITQYELDSRGNTSAIIDPLLQRTEFVRDAAGNVTIQKDSEGRITKTAYDSMGRVAQTIDAIGGETTFDYTPVGLLKKLTDPKGHSTQFEYNDQDLLSANKNALGQTETYQYDNDGNLIQKTTFAQQAIQFTYDANDRVTQKTAPDQTVQYGYDPDGLPTQIANSNSAIARSYDEQGRVRNETQSILPNVRLTYYYDQQGRRSRMIVSRNGSVIAEQNYWYDFNGDLGSITGLIGKQRLSYSRTLDGMRRLGSEETNNTQTNYTYDALSRVTKIENRTLYDTLSVFNYTYSPTGNIVKIEGAKNAQYTYDASNRIISASGDDKEAFTYDAVGNRTNNDETYNDLNQLLNNSDHTLQYDSNGNTLSIKKKDGSKETILTWSSENLLTGVSYKESGSLVKTISYRYDGLNRRVEKNLNDLVNPSKSQVRRYFYDGNNIVLEADGNGKILAYYMHTLELDHPLAMLRDLDGSNSFSSNEVFTFTRDHLGSIRELVNSQQKAIQRYQYSTYGKTTLEKADSSTDHQFVENLFAYTGREYDQDTEFYGYRNRYYSPELGRFISMDPIGLQGNDLNVYRYTFNNPLNFKDPRGTAIFYAQVGGGYAAANGPGSTNGHAGSYGAGVAYDTETGEMFSYSSSGSSSSSDTVTGMYAGFGLTAGYYPGSQQQFLGSGTTSTAAAGFGESAGFSQNSSSGINGYSIDPAGFGVGATYNTQQSNTTYGNHLAGPKSCPKRR